MWVFLACELLQKNFCMFNWPQRYPTHQEYTYSLHRLGRMARSWPGGTIFVPFLAVHGSLLAPGLLIDLTPTSIPARGWPCILLILLQAICGPHVWHFFWSSPADVWCESSLVPPASLETVLPATMSCMSCLDGLSHMVVMKSHQINFTPFQDHWAILSLHFDACMVSIRFTRTWPDITRSVRRPR